MHPLQKAELPRGTSWVCAVATGLMLGAGYAPLNVWPLTIAGLALFSWLVAGRSLGRAAGLGMLTGLAMNISTIHWIGVLGVPVAVALILFMSSWLALLGVMVALLTRLRAWALLVPAAWVAVEVVSGRVPLGGFPWNRLALTTLEQPMSGWLPWVGAAGVAFLLALLGQLLLVAVRTPQSRARSLVAAVSIMAVGASLKLVPAATPERQVTVGVVQGNVNRHLHGTASYASSVTNNMLSETVFLLAGSRAGGGQPLDFVLWPENATDRDPFSDRRTGDLVETSVALAGVPVLVGAVMDGPDPATTRQTSAIWWDPAMGPGDRYDKRNLVPFGEYIPMRNLLLPRMPILRQIGRQSIPGTGPGVLKAPTVEHGGLRVGDLICFELAWDDSAYDTVRAGADVVVSQSNTNTYGGTFQIHQQLAMNRLRAMELGREVVVSTLNSVSGLAAPDGSFTGATGEFTAANRSFTVPLRTTVTPAVVLNPWLAWLVAAVGFGGTAYAAVAPRRARGFGRLPRQSRAVIGTSR